MTNWTRVFVVMCERIGRVSSSPPLFAYIAIVASGATIAIYANNGGDELTLPIRSHMTTNTRVQFVLIYGVDPEAKAHAVAAVSTAVGDDALRILSLIHISEPTRPY